MFCNHCGATVGADQLVCGRCGQSPVQGRMAMLARSRVPEHLHLLATFWIVIGALCSIPVPILLALATGGHWLDTANLPPFLNFAGPLVLLSIAFAIGLFAVACLMTGWGLLKIRPWGRLLALVMAFIAIIHPPIGTALGIYTLYVLLPFDAGKEYDRMAAHSEIGGSAEARA
ncbi:MAG TPA: hypothetical protein VK473_01070 [Terriglobales bacterium]|nr:hypothetical protein [Terriglobales bacterium]